MTEQQELRLEVGALCLMTGLYNKAMRLISISNDRKAILTFQSVVEPNDLWRVYEDDTSGVAVISNAGALTKDMTLQSRRRELVNSLILLSDHSRPADHELISAIYSLVISGATANGRRIPGCPAWFYETISTAYDDARQLSWAHLPEYVDNDARRRRGRPKLFLDYCVRQGYLKMDEAQVERLAYLIGRSFPERESYTFKIISGEEIYKAYHSDSGPQTCMKGMRYVKFYSENPEVIRMIKIFRRKSFIGRALLWTATDGTTLLDRIYPSDGGLHIDALLRLAREQGWDFHSTQSYSQPFVSGKLYEVAVPRMSDSYFPYLDTFCYSKDIYARPLILSNNRRDAHYVMQATNGSVVHDDNWCYSSRCNGQECGYYSH